MSEQNENWKFSTTQYVEIICDECEKHLGYIQRDEFWQRTLCDKCYEKE